MATWITHLRIAENMLELIPGLVEDEFAIGNIAPDSGIPDEKWEKFTPPSEVTHFKIATDTPYQLADLEFYRKYLKRFLSRKKHPDQYSFLLGYFFHLVTDNLWSEIIGEPTIKRYKIQFDANRSFIWEVKMDWYGLDFEYVRDHPDSLYWRTFLHCEYPINYLDFLLPEGVRQVIKHIQTYYRQRDEHALEHLNHPRIYLTMPEVDAFVETATSRLHRINHYLQTTPMDTGRYYSALDIILPR
jgi:hypothetical protein